MGAFVGAVTSPFLRRRKGRIGKDRWVEKIAPTFAGAEIQMAEGNHIGMICCPNAFNSYQRNDNQASAAWSSVSLPALSFIGNAATAGRKVMARPFVDNAKWDLLDNPAQGSFYAMGTLTGTGGNCNRIYPTAKVNQNVFQVPAHPQEDIAFTDDGKFFCSVGSFLAGNSHCRGGELVEAPESFTQQTTAANGTGSVYPINDPAVPFPHFIMGDLNGGLPFHHIHRKPVGWRPASSAADAANPVAGLIVRKWIQYRNMVIGVGTQVDGVRSFDYGVTFAALANVTGAGPANALWRYGNRFFVCGRDIPRLRVSKNFGTTWSTNPVALPSVTAIPSAICEHQEQRYLFCHDGAINRVYVHKPFMDI